VALDEMNSLRERKKENERERERERKVDEGKQMRRETREMCAKFVTLLSLHIMRYIVSR